MSTAAPTRAPKITPVTIDTGMDTKDDADTPSPCTMAVKAENSAMTNMSSMEAPARMSWGIPLAVPHFSSMSCTILGTTTAGETAAITEPKRADSASVSPKRRGQTAQRPVFRSKRAQRT